MRRGELLESAFRVEQRLRAPPRWPWLHHQRRQGL